MATTALAIGFGIAATAFFVSYELQPLNKTEKAR